MKTIKLQFPQGADVAIVRITGNVKNCEPAHVRIAFPGGDVEVVRATDGEDADYWVHLRVNRPECGQYLKGETDTAKIIDARIDAHYPGKPKPAVVPFNNSKIYHLAVRIKRDEIIENEN